MGLAGQLVGFRRVTDVAGVTGVIRLARLWKLLLLCLCFHRVAASVALDYSFPGPPSPKPVRHRRLMQNVENTKTQPLLK